MFNIDLSETYWWPVKFNVPRETGATYEVMTFDAEFKRLPVEDIDALMARAAKDRLGDDKLAMELVVGWEGVQNKAKAPVPFSAESFKRALAISGLGSALVATFFESQAKALEKN